MSVAMIIYLIGVFDSLKGVSISIGIVSSIVALFGLIGVLSYGERIHIKVFKYSLYMLIFSLVVGSLLPSRNTSWMMVAGYMGQKAVESELSEELYGIAKIKLKLIAKDMQKELEGSVKKD